MNRRGHRIDMGEAVSFDSILTVLTVLLVLRMIFLIPMVNLDKAKLEQATKDNLWMDLAERLRGEEPGVQREAIPYAGLLWGKPDWVLHRTLAGGTSHLEALSADSTLEIMEHDPSSGRFHSLRVQGASEHPVFRRGRLLWSREEKIWFATADTTDYGEDSTSRLYLDRVRAQVVAP